MARIASLALILPLLACSGDSFLSGGAGGAGSSTASVTASGTVGTGTDAATSGSAATTVASTTTGATATAGPTTSTSTGSGGGSGDGGAGGGGGQGACQVDLSTLEDDFSGPNPAPFWTPYTSTGFAFTPTVRGGVLELAFGAGKADQARFAGLESGLGFLPAGGVVSAYFWQLTTGSIAVFALRSEAQQSGRPAKELTVVAGHTGVPNTFDLQVQFRDGDELPIALSPGFLEPPLQQQFYFVDKAGELCVRSAAAPGGDATVTEWVPCISDVEWLGCAQFALEVRETEAAQGATARFRPTGG